MPGPAVLPAAPISRQPASAVTALLAQDGSSQVPPAPLFFRPWHGAQWGLRGNALGGVRLLVLGESHYCGRPAQIGTCDPDVTSEVVEDLAIAGRHRFFTNITQVLSGRKRWQLTSAELSGLWESLVFYNYIPMYVAAGPRVRPSAEMFKKGAEPFANLVAELKPDAVLVCGFALWWWMLTGWSGFQGNPAEFSVYRLEHALAARMKHPSAGFSSDEWRPTVLALLQRAQTG
jgi:hypothetical protein